MTMNTDAVLKPFYFAALECPHSIDNNSVTLNFDPKQPGHNALHQLAKRLDAAVEARVEIALAADGPVRQAYKQFLEETADATRPYSRRALINCIADCQALSYSEDRGITVSEAESIGGVLHELRRLQNLEAEAVAIVTREDEAAKDDAPAREVIQPLEEPVTVSKAMLAGRNARVVLDKGVGPVAAVHLVNIGVTGWAHTKETAEAYAKGFNTAAKWMQHALTAFHAAPIEEPTANALNSLTRARDGWQEEAASLAKRLKYMEADNDLLRKHQSKDVWYFQGDGEDHIESMGNNMVVVIHANDLRSLIAAGIPPKVVGACPRCQLPLDQDCNCDAAHAARASSQQAVATLSASRNYWIDADENVPEDEREVLVFLNGHCGLLDDNARKGGGWGVRLGFYDHDKRIWRVHGQREQFVTHWQDEPGSPQSATKSAQKKLAVTDWRPIETAPKTAKWLMLFARYPNATAATPHFGYFHPIDEKWYESGLLGTCEIIPSHWMDRPEFPVATQSASGADHD